MRLTKYLFLFFTLAACLLYPNSVHADATEDAKKAILALYENDNIISTSNPEERGVLRSVEQAKQSFKYYTKDYVCIMSDGRKRTTAQLLSDLEMLFNNGLQSMKADGDIVTMSLKGNEAVVEMKCKVTSELRRKDGITIPLISDLHSRDFWVKVNGQWMIKRSRILSNSAFAEGRQIL